MRTVEDLVRRALLLEPPEVHHDDAVGEVAHDPEVVADEQVARRLRRLQVRQQVEDRGLDRHVEGARRLVAHDDAGIAGERPGDRDTLLQPARELAWPHVQMARRQTQCLGQLLHALVGGVALHAGQLVHRPLEDPPHAPRPVQRAVGVLEDHLHGPHVVGAALLGPTGEEVLVEEDLAARIRLVDAEHDLGQRALARP